MESLAGLFASLNFTLDQTPTELRPDVEALIHRIRHQAEQAPEFESQFELYSTAIREAIEMELPFRRADFPNPLVATIALYHVVGKPISWTTFHGRKRKVVEA